MKKIILGTATLALTFSAVINAQAATMNQRQLNEYKKGVDKLSCYYASACKLSMEDAQRLRGMVKRYQDMDLYGLNAASKKAYDKQAAEQLMKISQDDVKYYLGYLAKLTEQQMVEELTEDVVVSTYMKTPNYDVAPEQRATAEYAETEIKLDKKEYAAMVNAPDTRTEREIMEERTSQPPAYYKDVQFEQNEIEETNVELLNESTYAISTTIRTADMGRISTTQQVVSKVDMVRNADEGYRMMIKKLESSVELKIDEDAKNRSKPIYVGPKPEDISILKHKGPDPKQLEKSRFYLEEPREQILFERNQMALSLAVDMADEKYYNAEKARHDANVEMMLGNKKKHDELIEKAEKYEEQGDEYKKGGKQFYDYLRSNKDETTRELLQDYNELGTAKYDDIPDSSQPAESIQPVDEENGKYMKNIYQPKPEVVDDNTPIYSTEPVYGREPNVSIYDSEPYVADRNASVESIQPVYNENKHKKNIYQPKPKALDDAVNINDLPSNGSNISPKSNTGIRFDGYSDSIGGNYKRNEPIIIDDGYRGVRQ